MRVFFPYVQDYHLWELCPLLGKHWIESDRIKRGLSIHELEVAGGTEAVSLDPDLPVGACCPSPGMTEYEDWHEGNMLEKEEERKLGLKERVIEPEDELDLEMKVRNDNCSF